MTTAAVHPMNTALPRGGASTPASTGPPNTTINVTMSDETIKKPQQQTTSWTTKEGLVSNLKQTLTDVKTRASESLPESVRAQDWVTPVRQAYDTTRTKVQAARDSEQWNRVTTTVANNWQQAQQKAKHAMMKENDPAHSKETMEIVGQAFGDIHSFLGKVMFVFVVLANFFLMMLPDRILHLVGVRNNSLPGKFRLNRVTSSPGIWVGNYVMPVGSSNTIVLQGLDGKLLIRSPPEPTQEVVEALRRVGEPSALILGLSHDTFGDKWKAMFPNATVLAMRSEIPSINNRVKVDLALEDAEQVLQNFRIERILSTAEWSREEDPVLIVDLGQGRKAAMFGCGFTGASQSSTTFSLAYWRDVLLGRTCLGLLPIYGYIFGKNDKRDEAHRMWLQIAETPGLDTLLFLHGEPISGEKNLKAKMEAVKFSRLSWAQQ